MKKLLLLLTLSLSACDSKMDWNLPDGVSYQSTGWYQYYPATLNNEPARYHTSDYHCSDEGWLYSIPLDPAAEYPAVENSDGSQVVCNPTPEWQNDTEQTDVPVIR